MGLAFIPLYIKYMGIEAYGLIGLFMVMQVWFSLLDMGMTPTLSREMARFTAGIHTAQSIRNLLRTFEVITFIIAGFIVIILWFSSAWIAVDWLNVEAIPTSVVTQALSIAALVIGLRFCETIYRSAIIGLQQQVWLSVVNSAFSTLRHLGAVMVLALYSSTIQTFFVWQVITSLFLLIALRVKLYKLLPVILVKAKFSIDALKGVWLFASGMIGISLLSILLVQVDKVLLSKLLTLEMFGYYMLASAVAGVLIMIVGPITQAIYPRMVETYSQGDIKSLIRAYHLGSQVVTVVLTPIVLVISFFPHEIIYLWSGDSMLAEKTGGVLRLLTIGTFLNCLMWMPYHCQLAYGWTSLALRVNVVAVLLLVPAIIWLVPQYGVNAAAWIWIVLNSSYIVISIQLMHRRIMPKEQMNWYINDVFIPVFGAMAFILFINEFISVGNYSRIVLICYLAIVTVLLFVVTSILSNHIRPRVFLVAKGLMENRLGNN